MLLLLVLPQFATSAGTSALQAALVERFDCKGYTVEGAGNSSFNGCYLPSNETRNGQTQYVLDNSHILFQWRGGAWGLGKPGSARSYTAGDVTAYPPVVTDSVPWETCDLGVNPPPYLSRC